MRADTRAGTLQHTVKLKFCQISVIEVSDVVEDCTQQPLLGSSTFLGLFGP